MKCWGGEWGERELYFQNLDFVYGLDGSTRHQRGPILLLLQDPKVSGDPIPRGHLGLPSGFVLSAKEYGAKFCETRQTLPLNAKL